jgi:signal transduction histidine kinase/ligand-binding sensor domain-containing protein
MKKINLIHKVILISFLSGMMISPPLFAQKPNYKFKSISQPDGLMSSTVQCIFEDSFGFIWLGTQHGVQRYDGKTYRNFEYDRNDSTGLSHNAINGFFEDIHHNIWIATPNGLSIYYRATDKIVKYNWHNKFIIESGKTGILRIFSDVSDPDIIWLTARGIGIVKLNIQNDSAAVFSSGTGNDRLFSWILPNPVNENELLIGGDRLFSFDKTSEKFRELYALEENADIPNNLINDAVIDPENKNIIWLATGDYWGRGSLGGLIQFDLITGSKKIFSPETRKTDLPDRHLLCLCFYDMDHLWIGTRIQGALLYNRKEDRFYNFENNEFDEGSFVTNNSVRSMLVDRSGTMWFGTWGDGIAVLSPAAQKFSHYKHLPGEKYGLSDNYVNTFTEDNHGNIWIGTKAGGVSKFNPATKTFEDYFQEFSSSGSNPSEINYLFFDSHDNLWIGTYSDALYRYDPARGIKIHYKKGTSAKDVTQNRISGISELKQGEILVSTYGGGLNIYSYESDSFRHCLHDQNDSTSIPDNQIWLPFLGDDGKYYFSGNSVASLFQFDPATEKFKEILSRSVLSSFMMPVKTSDGKIYINDVGSGLTELKLGNAVAVNPVLDLNEKSIINVESILVDSDNVLWMGTGNGLVEFDPEMKTIHRYDADDGLQGYDFNRFAGFKSSTGDMYFGGKNGFSVFNPDEIKLSRFEPPVEFTDFKLFQESVSIGEGSPLKVNISLLDKLELAYDQNDFSISFAALDFSNPQKIEYKYILENHDEGWISVGHHNSASYTNMDPGDYTLKVLATNGDGVWNEKVKSLRIIINPPWWLTTWAYGFYIFLFAAGVFGIDRFMRNRLMRRERERSRAYKLEQAKKIEKAYNDLKATQSQLIHSEKMASLGELTAGIAHEIQNPLNFVNNFSEVSQELLVEMKQDLAAGSWQSADEIAENIRQNLEKILHHGKRADAIVKGMLQHSRNSSGVKEPTDINLLADEYLRLAYHGLRAKNKSFNADFRTELDNTLPKIDVIPQDFGRVLLNLINNAFYAVQMRNAEQTQQVASADQAKYKPTIIVSTKKWGDMVEIRVKDNGGGIPGKVLDKIFQPFFTTKPTGEGTGLGLSLSFDIITKGHGGTLEVKTKEGEGTEFIILLPLTKLTNL